MTRPSGTDKRAILHRIGRKLVDHHAKRQGSPRPEQDIRPSKTRRPSWRPMYGSISLTRTSRSGTSPQPSRVSRSYALASACKRPRKVVYSGRPRGLLQRLPGQGGHHGQHVLDPVVQLTDQQALLFLGGLSVVTSTKVRSRPSTSLRPFR